MHLLITFVFVLVAVWAVYSDFRYRRISNLATFGAAAAGLLLRLALGGPWPALVGLEGWALGVALLAVPFALGWMGAGDVKLLAAFGALGGPGFALQAALLGCIAGGAMAVLALLREHKLGKTLTYFGHALLHPFTAGRLPVQRRMPFGPALAAGATASLVLARAVL